MAISEERKIYCDVIDRVFKDNSCIIFVQHNKKYKDIQDFICDISLHPDEWIFTCDTCTYVPNDRCIILKSYHPLSVKYETAGVVEENIFYSI